MKILHCCLSCFYIDGYNYQENVLPKIHQEQGHDVKILASTETIIDNKRLGYLKPSIYKTETGIEVTRLPYIKTFPRKLGKKIRAYIGVYKYLNQYNPDIILFHGVPAYDLITVAKYKKKNQDVKLFVDSHEDSNNSARNFISKYLLHQIIYKHFVKKSLKHIDKILYVAPEVKDFLIENYSIPEDLLEFYPLGGTVISQRKKKEYRDEILKNMGFNSDNLIFTHSGKMNKKKKTLELVQNFSLVKDERLRLIIIGTLMDDIKDDVIPLIEKDKRVHYLGWKDSDELLKYIAASDLYIQPGSQSATMQNALCSGTPVLFANVKSHQVYMEGNAFAINSVKEIKSIIENILKDPNILKNMSENAFNLSSKILDYEKLAKRIID